MGSTRSVSTRSVFLVFFSSEPILKTKNTCFDLIRFASRVFLFIPRIQFLNGSCSVQFRFDKRPHTCSSSLAHSTPFFVPWFRLEFLYRANHPFSFHTDLELSKKLNESMRITIVNLIHHSN